VLKCRDLLVHVARCDGSGQLLRVNERAFVAVAMIDSESDRRPTMASKSGGNSDRFVGVVERLPLRARNRPAFGAVE
jgi:hypothetical protein